MLRGFTRRFKPLELLTQEQAEDIHRATLAVLRETGVHFESEWALDYLKKNGCLVDDAAKLVRFPEGLVEECLRRCPSSYRLKARDPKNDMILGGNTVSFTQAAGMRTIDLDTLEPRAPTRTEYVNYVKILDALPNLHWLNAYPYFGFAGVPPVMCIPEGFALKTRYSSKFAMEGASNGCEVFNIRMAQAAGAEVMSAMGSQPPLSWSGDVILQIRRMIEAGFPIGLSDGNAYGATAPATFAGALAVCNAEIISMIVLVQLLSPGHRIRAGHFAFPQDMRSGSPAFGDIGCSISNIMFNQMWRRYGIPISNGTPGYPSSKSIDYQTGYEKGMAAMLSAISGANMICLHGGVNGELSAHAVQAILDDDIAGMVGRLLAGSEVNDETLALELIEEVGPVPGHYLSKAHTRKWWKSEQYVPAVADRMSYPEWMRTGKKKAIDYAKARMEGLLAAHKPTPLTAEQEQAIDEILEEARQYYRSKGLISESEWTEYAKALEMAG